ncbi:MAG: DUF72 domain-containing protein [Gemmatales bacterium]|nr:DUF72 domain-containing protein [Gemmatales bacterium]MDW8387548.1 DUF72 domain-containing protein [Gemmatales bacterium]
MEVWVGTSGYSYADWVGVFYPNGMRPDRMLAYYVTQFPLVELNFTFYRLPTRRDLDRLADKTPSGFQFLVKLPQTISHDLDLHDLAPFRDSLQGLEERRQLLGVLAQFPQRFHDTVSNRDYVRRLAAELSGQGLAIEFRHVSWAKPETPRWLGELGPHLVSVDVPEIPALFPRGLVQSGDLVYVRLHSRRAASWYESDKERYDYSYSDVEMTEWVEGLRSVANRTSRAWVLFNNCQRGQAAANALRFAQLLRELAPELAVVSPFAEMGPRQRSLFE